MNTVKKVLFKVMELGLGLKTFFTLETCNPVFINFRLSSEDAERVRSQLPPHFCLEKLRFVESDQQAEYWLSYNLYEIRYPRKELSGVRKVRCEINTFVKGPNGRNGIYVFCGSPFVSKETRLSLMGTICDLAERFVMLIYGCGKLIPLEYNLTDSRINVLGKNYALGFEGEMENLSEDYARFNDVSFFNRGRTYDLVNVDSAFSLARFSTIEPGLLKDWSVATDFFSRPPDKVIYHRGKISYTVNALNKTKCCL